MSSFCCLDDPVERHFFPLGMGRIGTFFSPSLFPGAALFHRFQSHEHPTVARPRANVRSISSCDILKVLNTWI